MDTRDTYFVGEVLRVGFAKALRIFRAYATMTKELKYKGDLTARVAWVSGIRGPHGTPACVIMPPCNYCKRASTVPRCSSCRSEHERVAASSAADPLEGNR